MERALGMAVPPKDNDVDFESVTGSLRKSESVFLSLSKSSFVEPSKQMNVNDKIEKTIARLERKKQILQEKIVDLEVDNDLLNGLLVDKEKEIYHLTTRIEDLLLEKKQLSKRNSVEMLHI